MTRRQYDDETKSAVMAALLTGQSVSSVAEEYKLPRGTVAYWSAQLNPPIDQTDPNIKKDIGDKLLTYLSAALDTLTAQVRFFADEEWLRKQPASELAVLHGVTADKTIRLLEALSAGQDADGPAV